MTTPAPEARSSLPCPAVIAAAAAAVSLQQGGGGGDGARPGGVAALPNLNLPSHLSVLMMDMDQTNPAAAAPPAAAAALASPMGLPV